MPGVGGTTWRGVPSEIQTPRNSDTGCQTPTVWGCQTPEVTDKELIIGKESSSRFYVEVRKRLSAPAAGAGFHPPVADWRPEEPGEMGESDLNGGKGRLVAKPSTKRKREPVGRLFPSI
jgi:hypothetical protein